MITKDDDKIDLMNLVKVIWDSKRLTLKVSGIGLAIGILIAWSIPNEYTASTKMLSETDNQTNTGNMGALANMVGISSSGATNGNNITPNIYPDIINSTPFLLDLFQIKVPFKNKEKEISLYDYMDKHQRKTWWKRGMEAPLLGLNWIMSIFKEKKENEETKKVINHKNLTHRQNIIATAISSRVKVSNSKNGIILIEVTMQDPEISAVITDSLVMYLQNYLVEYRTNKANRDLKYIQKLHDEARDVYYTAQQSYANFADTNLDIVMSGYRTRLDRLQNEMNLAYGVYNQVSQQLQIAKAKVQEETPAYTIIQPSITPLYPTSPNKTLIIIGFFFAAFFGSIIFSLSISFLRKQDKS